MIFKDVFPSLPLQKLVQYYRLRHFIIPPGKEAQPKPFPARPEQCMTFYPRGYEITEVAPEFLKVVKPRSVISGQYTCRINRYSGTSEFLMIQVVFHPGILHRLIGIPFYELVNKHLDLEYVLGRESIILNDKLSNTSDYKEMISLIEDFLLQLSLRQKESAPADEIFKLMAEQPGRFSLQWLADQACLSSRQFERRAKQYLGISPHLFARIARFNESYKLRLKAPAEDWLSIAVAAGYHDYQHMVRDYKEFATTTPTILFRQEYNTLERILGLHK